MKKIFIISMAFLTCAGLINADVTEAGTNREVSGERPSQNVNDSKFTKTQGRSTFNFIMDN